jgi:hypothetical protein
MENHNTFIKSALTKYKQFLVYYIRTDESKPSQRVPLFMK